MIWGTDTLRETRVTLTVEGTPTDFVVDTGAEFLVLTEPLEKLRTQKSLVFGATGQKPYSWTTDKKVNLRRSQVTHSFLNILECQRHCWVETYYHIKSPNKLLFGRKFNLLISPSLYNFSFKIRSI